MLHQHVRALRPSVPAIPELLGQPASVVVSLRAELRTAPV